MALGAKLKSVLKCEADDSSVGALSGNSDLRQHDRQLSPPRRDRRRWNRVVYTAGQLLAVDEPQFAVDLVRPPADAVRARPLRRRTGPPEDQIGHPGLRQDPAARALPLLRHVELGGDAQPPAEPLERYHAVVTRSAPRPTTRLGIRVQRPAARTPPRSSWPGTTATPTSRPRVRPAGKQAVVVGPATSPIDVARMLALRSLELAGHRHGRPRDRGVAGQRDRGDHDPRSPGSAAGRVHQSRAA